MPYLPALARLGAGSVVGLAAGLGAAGFLVALARAVGAGFFGFAGAATAGAAATSGLAALPFAAVGP